MSLSANAMGAHLINLPPLPSHGCCQCEQKEKQQQERRLRKPTLAPWKKIASSSHYQKRRKNDEEESNSKNNLIGNDSNDDNNNNNDSNNDDDYQWLMKNIAIQLTNKNEDATTSNNNNNQFLNVVELYFTATIRGNEPIFEASSVRRSRRGGATDTPVLLLDAKVDRPIDETTLLNILQKNPSLVKRRLPFFSERAPILYHLCLFHNASLSLIRRITEQYPDVLNSPPLFGWLTPVHLAAIRMTSNQQELLLWLLSLYSNNNTPSQLLTSYNNIQEVSILHLLLRRTSCYETFVRCLETTWLESHVREVDYAGNNVLHLACDVSTGGYDEKILGSSAVAYGGCRPDVVEYLLSKYPDLASRPNKKYQLPLHCLLQCKNPPTRLIIDLLNAYPAAVKARMRLQPMNHNSDSPQYYYGNLPVELACRNGASEEVVRRLYEAHPSPLLCPINLAFGRDMADVLILNHDSSDDAISYLLSKLPKKNEFCYSEIPILHPFKLRALRDYFSSSKELSVIKLTNSSIRGTGMMMMLNALFTNTNVVTINLSGSIVPSRTVAHSILRQIIKRSSTSPNNEERDEARKQIEDEHASPDRFASHLCQCLYQNNHVEHLDLSNNVLPYPDRWLRPLPQDRTLKVLKLSSCHLGLDQEEGEVSKILVETIRSNRTLQELYLDDNNLSEDTILSILGALKETDNTSLVRIRLSASSLSEGIMKNAVETVVSNHSIQYLDFPYFWKKKNDEDDDDKDKRLLLTCYWRKIQYHCSLNRVVRDVFVGGSWRKDRFVNNLIIPSGNNTQMLYGILRLEPDRWSLS